MLCKELGLLASAFFLFMCEVVFLVVMEVFGPKPLNLVGHFLEEGHIRSMVGYLRQLCGMS